MFRFAIRLGDNTETSDVLDAFRKHVDQAQLGPAGDQLRVQVERIVQSFASSGAKLSQAGSQFAAQRTLADPLYKVKITARFGQKISILSRLGRLLGRR